MKAKGKEKKGQGNRVNAMYHGQANSSALASEATKTTESARATVNALKPTSQRTSRPGPAAVKSSQVNTRERSRLLRVFAEARLFHHVGVGCYGS